MEGGRWRRKVEEEGVGEGGRWRGQVEGEGGGCRLRAAGIDTQKVLKRMKVKVKLRVGIGILNESLKRIIHSLFIGILLLLVIHLQDIVNNVTNIYCLVGNYLFNPLLTQLMVSTNTAVKIRGLATWMRRKIGGNRHSQERNGLGGGYVSAIKMHSHIN